jgi:hypothetical protein
MSIFLWGILISCGAIGMVAAAYWYALRKRQMHLWLGAYYFTPRPKANRLSDGEPVHVFIAVCDHYEPEWGKPSPSTSIARVQRWVDEYPRLFEKYRDSSGRAPQHTYFFPQDEYRPEYLDLLAGLVHRGLGDVDVHLHHDGDTAESLRQKLHDFKVTLHERHGLLRRDPITNEIVYGFIHGNWALCNSRPDGRWCGVDQELTVLQETGCYADFTLPSAPSNTQIRLVNSIYYATDIPGRCGSHNWGVPAQVGTAAPNDHLLMIQGALLPDWRNRKLGIFPRIENSDIHGGRPASWKRFQDWTRAGVHVAGRPDWLFVKLHTHGCKDGNIDTWLGPESQRFHQDLADQARMNSNLKYHYVTAWEMAQLVHQAERGETVPSLGANSRDAAVLK